MKYLRKNPHLLQKSRDNQILSTLERLTILNTTQIQTLFFDGISQAENICNRRLKKLFASRKINRDRRSLSEPYYYFLGKQPAQIDHQLGINWLYIWLLKQLTPGEQEYFWQSPYKLGNIIPDALFASYKGNTYRFAFLEFDNSSHNTFTKIRQYNELYEKSLLSDDHYWWNKKTDSTFPAVIICTTTYNKLKSIQNRILDENKYNLEFTLLLLDNIKNELTRKQQNIIVWRGFS